MGISIDFDRINEDVIQNIDKTIEELDSARLGVYGLPHDDIMPPELNIGDRLTTIIETLTSIKTTISNNVEELILGEEANDSIIARLFASLINGVAGIIGGVGEVAEAGVDLFATAYGLLWGLSNYAGYFLGSGFDNEVAKQAAENAMKDTMGFISEDYVESYLGRFYNTSVGKWINKNAYEFFKQNGMGFSFLKGLGETGGRVFLSTLTGIDPTIIAGLVGGAEEEERVLEMEKEMSNGENWAVGTEGVSALLAGLLGRSLGNASMGYGC